LKARLLRREEARAKGEPDPGMKRKRDRHRDDDDAFRTTKKAARAEDDAASRDEETAHEKPGSDDAKPKPKSEADAAFRCDACGVKCGTRANFDTHRDSKRHKAKAQQAKGKVMLDAMKARRILTREEAKESK
jgi:hypothetical protein